VGLLPAPWDPAGGVGSWEAMGKGRRRQASGARRGVGEKGVASFPDKCPLERVQKKVNENIRI